MSQALWNEINDLKKEVEALKAELAKLKTIRLAEVVTRKDRKPNG